MPATNNPKFKRFSTAVHYLLFITCMLSVISCKKLDTNGAGLISVKTGINISSYPPAEQRMLYALMTANEKYYAWKSHLNEFMEHSEHNTDQRQFVKAVIDYITPQLFARPLSNGEWQQLESIRKNSFRLFGKEASVQLFSSLQSFAIHNPKPGNSINYLEGDVVSCNCSMHSDYCSGLSSCLSHTCTSGGACGTFWMYTCDGMCGYF